MSNVELRARRQAIGLCVDCGQPEPDRKPESGKQRCAFCLEHDRERIARRRAEQRRAKRLAANLCANCGRRAHLPSMEVCDDCRATFPHER